MPNQVSLIANVMTNTASFELSRHFCDSNSYYTVVASVMTKMFSVVLKYHPK